MYPVGKYAVGRAKLEFYLTTLEGGLPSLTLIPLALIHSPHLGEKKKSANIWQRHATPNCLATTKTLSGPEVGAAGDCALGHLGCVRPSVEDPEKQLGA